MKQLKEFLNRETIVKCLVFALFVSLLFAWRFTHIKQLPFFTFRTFQIYLSFTVVNFLIFLAIFYGVVLAQPQEPAGLVVSIRF